MTIPTPNMLLGSYLRQMRKAKGYGQRELGRLIKVSPQIICDCENGKRRASQNLLTKLAPILELDVAELVSRGGHIPEQVIEYIAEHPSAGVLLQRFVTYNLSERSLQLFTNHIDLLVEKARKRQAEQEDTIDNETLDSDEDMSEEDAFSSDSYNEVEDDE